MRFNPSRLALARRRRGKTQTRLAIDCGVDVRNIRRYEAGEMPPSEATLDALAAALEFPRSFFVASEELPLLPVKGASFRSLSTMTQLQAEAALSAGSIATQLAAYLNQHLVLPTSNVPDLRGDPGQAANELRAAWGLGNRPIPNVVHLLEAHGVRVFSLVEDCASVDAFSVWHDGVPFVFLNTMKSAEHSRFDAAHELGHLVLHAVTQRRGRDVEHEANLFASAFLMPRADVLAETPKNPNRERILGLKKRWGVSAVAAARRFYDLGLLREWHYKQLCIEMSRLGYRKAEPQALPQREQSQLLRKAFELLRQKGVGRQELASALDINVEELDRMVFGLAMVPLPGEGGAGGKSRAPLRVIRGSKKE